MLSRRRGSCENCGGICCIRTRAFPLLKNGKCSIYLKGIPFFCKIFPIDYSNSASSSRITPNQVQEYPFLPIFPVSNFI